MLTRMSLSVILVFYLTATQAQENTMSQMRTFIVEYSIQGPAATSANQYVKTTVNAMNYDQAKAMVEGMFNGTAHIFSVQEQR